MTNTIPTSGSRHASTNGVNTPSGMNNPTTVPATLPVRFYCLSKL